MFVRAEKVHAPRTSSLLSLLREIELVRGVSRTYSVKASGWSEDIVRDLRTLLLPGRFETVSYFIKHGAATAWILRFRLNLPRRTVYDYLELFRNIGIIIPQIQIKPVDKMRRPATIWGLPDCTIEQVKAAYQLHLRLFSPKYRVAERVAQNLLKPHIAELTYRDIVKHVRQQNISFNVPDIANLAARYLHEQGIKIWR